MAAQMELAASSDSVAAHCRHFGSHFQRRISQTAMRMESNNQLASAAAMKVRPSKERHSSTEGQQRQWCCSAVPRQQKRLMATMPQKSRGHCIFAKCLGITAADSGGAALEKLSM